MNSASILEMLRLEASTGQAPSGSDALAQLVHWLAAHTAQLSEQDVRVLFDVGLSLYNTELEKSWNVNVDSPPVMVGSASQSGRRADTGDVHASRESVEIPLASEQAQARARAEAAITALVEMRRPDAPDARRDNKPRRRWSDAPGWALTYRGS